jgi:hypothetical protein
MTALLREFGAVLGDVALRAVVVLALIAAPVLAVQAVAAGVLLAMERLGPK